MQDYQNPYQPPESESVTPVTPTQPGNHLAAAKSGLVVGSVIGAVLGGITVVLMAAAFNSVTPNAWSTKAAYGAWVIYSIFGFGPIVLGGVLGAVGCILASVAASMAWRRRPQGSAGQVPPQETT